MKRSEVFGAISSERAYQESKWDKPKSSVAEYLVYMRHHLDKAFKSMSTGEPIEMCDSVISQVRKVSALGVACGEQHGMCYREGFYSQVFFNGDKVMFQGKGERELSGMFKCVCADEETATFAAIRLDAGGSYTSFGSLVVIRNDEEILNQVSFTKLDDEQFNVLVARAVESIKFEKDVIKIDGRELI